MPHSENYCDAKAQPTTAPPRSFSSSSTSNLPTSAMSLPELWYKARELSRQREEAQLSATDPAYQRSVQREFLYLSQLHRKMDEAELFSGNEELREISSGHLKYLLTPFLLAESLLAFSGREGRLKRVRKALSHLSDFLGRCDQYRLMSPVERARWKQGPGSVNTGLRREEKIAAFQHAQELQAKIKAGEQRMAALRARHKRRMGGLNEEEEEQRDKEWEDEEVGREVAELHLRWAVSKALDHLHYLGQEIQMLQHDMANQNLAQQPSQVRGSDARSSATQRKEPSRAAPAIHHISSTEELSKPIPAALQKHMVRVKAPPPEQETRDYKAGSRKQKGGKTAKIWSCCPGHGPGEASHGHREASHEHAHGSVGRGDLAASGGTSLGLSSTDRIILSRTDVRSQVFREPNPSSLTLTQWADLEIRDGRLPGPDDQPVAPPQIDRRKIASATAALSSDEEEDEEMDDQLSERATYKARDWDNWKDDHEKGAGNKLAKK
eukprot:gb/GEZN01003721.1/.p1 GENE.gb/GEZN01003721.1/~~gb/GEZN01003721.1/.p1  ORF type:complete len:495 (+),score=73.80 gb/GEZN01003721.1/:574-2058(+)